MFCGENTHGRARNLTFSMRRPARFLKHKNSVTPIRASPIRLHFEIGVSTTFSNGDFRILFAGLLDTTDSSDLTHASPPFGYLPSRAAPRSLSLGRICV